MPIVIGMGTGRSGTMSLSRLISAQDRAVCFHELNPACMKWRDTPRTVRSMLAEFDDVLNGGPREVTVDHTSFAKEEPLARLASLPAVRTIGDVAFYYLPYAPLFAESGLDVRMPCLRRDKAEVVSSFVRSARLTDKKRPFLQRLERRLRGRREITHVNHWMNHDGATWRLAPKWDKLFPKFECETMEDAVAAYWDHYDETAARYEAAYPDRFRVFDIATLNDEAGRAAILSFCGVDATHVRSGFHLNSVA